MSEANERVCSKCGETKPLTAEYFYPDGRLKSGFELRCLVCRSAYAKKHYQRTKDSVLTVWKKRPTTLVFPLGQDVDATVTVNGDFTEDVLDEIIEHLQVMHKSFKRGDDPETA